MKKINWNDLSYADQDKIIRVLFTFDKPPESFQMFDHYRRWAEKAWTNLQAISAEYK